MKKILLIVVLLFICIINVSADDIIDYTGSGNTVGTPSGGGDWQWSVVGMRLSLVSKEGNLKAVKVILNNSYNVNNIKYFHAVNNPKFLKQTFTKQWVNKSSFTYYVDDELPSNWYTNTNKIVKLSEKLKADNYKLLKYFVNKYISSSALADDYIVIEPMTLISGVCGTAYELAHSGITYNDGGTPRNIFYWYAAAMGGNNTQYPNGGVLSETLYDVKDVTIGGITITKATGTDANGKNQCLSSSTCGRGIGIYKYSDITPTGTLIIKKRDWNGNVIQPEPMKKSTVEFMIYKKNGSTWILYNTTAYSIDLFQTDSKKLELLPGKYKITEISAPGGYEISGKIKVGTTTKTGSSIEVTVDSNTSKTVIFYNKKISTQVTCDDEIVGTQNNPLKRIELFKKYSHRNLLDFDNQSSACSSTTQSEIKTASCLSVNYSNSSTFSATDISDYVEIVDINGNTGFCVYEYKLQNLIPAPNLGNVTSGKILLDSSKSTIAQVNLIKNCYFYSTSQNINIDENSFSQEELENYIGNLSFNNKILDYEMDSYNVKISNSIPVFVGSSTQYYKNVTIELIGKYLLSPIYIKKGIGEICTSINQTNCINIGRVFLSKFSDVGRINVPFSVIFGENKIDLINSCYYTATPELIDNELKLEFRTISKSNPFTGKNGSGRNTGSNWCNGTDCSSTNETVKNVILDRNDSYDSTGDGPIYRIELKPYDIKLIRKKYSAKKYDEFYLDCDMNATNCKSLLLQEFNIKRLK